MEYFNCKMTPAEAMAHHNALLKANPQAQLNIADASVNPKRRTVYDWFEKWRLQNLGPPEGDGIWAILERKLSDYNAAGAKVNKLCCSRNFLIIFFRFFRFSIAEIRSLFSY